MDKTKLIMKTSWCTALAIPGWVEAIAKAFGKTWLKVSSKALIINKTININKNRYGIQEIR